MNKELRAKTNEELIDLVVRLKGQLLQYRFKQAQGELEKPHVIKETRQVLARIYTILTERKVNINVTNKMNSTMLQPKAVNAAVSAKAEAQKLKAEKRAAKLAKRTTNKQKVATQAPKPKVVKKYEAIATKTYNTQPQKMSKLQLRNAKAKKSQKIGFKRKGGV